MPRMIPSARPPRPAEGTHAQAVLRPAPSSAAGPLAAAALAALTVATVALLPAPATAQAALAETLTPEPRPYPWRILDIQPGATADDAVSMFQERMMVLMEPEEVQVRVQSPEGREIEFAYPQRMTTPPLPMGANRGSEPYITMDASLATPVMGNRVVAVSRSQRSLTTELPSPAALRAQVEGLYGPPSQVDMTAGDMQLTWAWGEGGFIPDLDAVTEKTMQFDPGDGTTKTITYRPCVGASGEMDYRFKQVRSYVIAPGCIATFVVYFEGGARFSNMFFTINDYDLARRNVAETDRQIFEALTGDAGDVVAPSDIDL